MRKSPFAIVNLICAIFTLGIFLSGGSASCADADRGKKNPGIEAAAAVDKARIRIGDKIIYSLTAKAKSNIEVEFPQILPLESAGFAVKGSGSSQKGLFGRNTFRRWYILDTYVSGEHTLPAAAIKYRVKGKTDWQELSVNEVKLEVKSVLDAATNKIALRDIRGPKSFAGQMRLYALVTLTLLLMSAAIFCLILLRKKRDGRRAPPVPAHIIAYEALAALEKKDYIRKGLTKIYYTELSDIARRYLEHRFNIRAPEMTTEEFLIKVKEDSILSLEHKGLLRDFLTHCDLVKFAQYQPAETEASLSLPLARQLIDQTKQEDKP